ncbi:MAG: ClpXP protease specificity-enhancing factor [Proteobacteria bacterium]|nr:ClpXP protease specificity-enhancing factor [Pseudomonadota bacterium]MBS0461031.1 ClpXP protease specificity-enhancing factor [Pseudomonadota bacterium]MBS0465401.1 ClpXP protease specificity-enhancing factor [Pseudomonadota bacterium]
MTSNRPYLLRAMYEWINDNGMTPYILVDAAFPGVLVPSQAVKDGRVVLNIAARAVSQLSLGDAEIGFLARFGGVSQPVRVPLGAVQAIYAQESGQGMALPDDATGAVAGPSAPAAPADKPPGEPPDRGPPSGGKRGAKLRVVK